MGHVAGTAGSPVAVCGATGFVGAALAARLLRDASRVRALVRPSSPGARRLPTGVEPVEGDLLEGSGLDRLLSGVPIAYYLVHSMGTRTGGLDFAEADRRAARAFVDAATRAGVRRIVYLGGLGDDAPSPSRHLESRREVGRILRSGSPAVTELRAGIVVGPGGSSFEMMVQLVERLPLMLCPIWIDRRCQPIALADLVEYLVRCRHEERTAGGRFDVGGPEVLRYSEMLMVIGSQLGRRPCLLVIPRFTPTLSAHWVGYITDVPAELARPVIDGMYVDAVCREQRIGTIVPIELTPFPRAVQDALTARRKAHGGPGLVGGHPVRPLEGRVVRLYRRRDEGSPGLLPRS